MKDHPDERPPWWKTVLLRDHLDQRPSWWETTLMKDHLMRDHQLNERPPWWETTLMKDYSVEMPHWWKTGLRDQPSFKSTCSDSTCFEKHFSLRKKKKTQFKNCTVAPDSGDSTQGVYSWKHEVDWHHKKSLRPVYINKIKAWICPFSRRILCRHQRARTHTYTHAYTVHGMTRR